MLKRKMISQIHEIRRQNNGRVAALKRKCSVLALAFHLFSDDRCPTGDSNRILKKYMRRATEILKRASSDDIEPMEEFFARYNVEKP